jgi:hypothetical protein
MKATSTLVLTFLDKFFLEFGSTTRLLDLKNVHVNPKIRSLNFFEIWVKIYSKSQKI